jgi:UDP-glucose 4-epimerase
MSATYLVTGGAGFIGSHLVASLRAEGHHVRVVDDFSTGRRENLPEGGPEGGPEEIAVIEGSITDAALMREAVAGVAGCFHLAAIASVERGIEAWRATHEVNLGGLITLFEAIRGLPAPVPVIYASSAAVYGDAADLPITEQTATRPLSAYGADKLGCEQHALVASHVHGIPTLGLRFFNVYGPRQDPRSPYSGVISIFCDRLRAGQPIAVFGDGGQTRDFVFVADVVAALGAAMAGLRAGRVTPAGVFPASVFNVCTGHATSVLELAETIAGLCGRRAEMRFAPARKGEIRHSLGAPAAARAALGLGDPVPLRHGLAATLNWLETAAVR